MCRLDVTAAVAGSGAPAAGFGDRAGATRADGLARRFATLRERGVVA